MRHPASVSTYRWPSARATVVSKGRRPVRRSSRSSLASFAAVAASSAYRCNEPLTSTGTPSRRTPGAASSEACSPGILPRSRSSCSRAAPVNVPTRTCASMASALVSPQPLPSGVSMGQMSPHCVTCSCRGLGFLVSLATGVATLRRSASVAGDVMRPSCCDTPFCAVFPRVDMIPQFPVASPYRKACVSFLPATRLPTLV